MQKNKTECKMTLRNEKPHVNKCFPRIRGDVPLPSGLMRLILMFSPHTRGCSLGQYMAQVGIPVFPAYAGMFPLL